LATWYAPADNHLGALGEGGRLLRVLVVEEALDLGDLELPVGADGDADRVQVAAYCTP
jgi:hypothetical protein